MKEMWMEGEKGVRKLVRNYVKKKEMKSPHLICHPYYTILGRRS